MAAAKVIDFPEDAISVYQPAIATFINQTDYKAYKQAINLLEKLRKIFVRLNHSADFNAYVNQSQKSYKRKRNYIKLLVQHGMA